MQRDNSGVLFKNDRKEEGSNHPDYKGNALVNGTPMDMAVWLSTSKNGVKYLSVKFSEPRKKDQPFSKAAEDLDDVPF